MIYNETKEQASNNKEHKTQFPNSFNTKISAKKKNHINVNCIQSYLTHEFLPVFVPHCSNFIGWGHFPFATPGIQKIFNITHDSSVFFQPKKTKVKSHYL